MDEVKNQHTVPVCYLANFGIDGNKKRDSQVYFYDTITSKTRCISVVNIANEKFFYDNPDWGEHKQIIEHLFTEVEGNYSTISSCILPRIEDVLRFPIPNTGIISIEEKEELAAFFAFQFIRTRQFREQCRDMYEQLHAHFPIPDCTEETLRSIHTQGIINFRLVNFLANILTDWNWVIMLNKTEVPFITSDNPVIAINRSLESEGISLANPELTYYVPLSPKIAIEIIHRNLLKADRCTVIVPDARMIKTYSLFFVYINFF